MSSATFIPPLSTSLWNVISRGSDDNALLNLDLVPSSAARPPTRSTLAVSRNTLGYVLDVSRASEWTFPKGKSHATTSAHPSRNGSLSKLHAHTSCLTRDARGFADASRFVPAADAALAGSTSPPSAYRGTGADPGADPGADRAATRAAPSARIPRRTPP